MLAAADNEAATILANYWAGHKVTRLTPRDLSTEGWRFVPGRRELGRAVIGGELTPESEIRGVLTLLPAVTADQLPWIAEEDRTYAAAEMHAFLFAWLSALACPVLSRPSAGSLCGVAWPRERWLALAAAHDIPISSDAVTSTADTPYTLYESGVAALRVTVIADKAIGNASVESRDLAHRLAAAAGTGLLVVEFARHRGGLVFSSAHPFPDICDPEIAAAVLAALTSER